MAYFFQLSCVRHYRIGDYVDAFEENAASEFGVRCYIGDLIGECVITLEGQRT